MNKQKGFDSPGVLLVENRDVQVLSADCIKMGLCPLQIELSALL